MKRNFSDKVWRLWQTHDGSELTYGLGPLAFSGRFHGGREPQNRFMLFLFMRVFKKRHLRKFLSIQRTVYMRILPDRLCIRQCKVEIPSVPFPVEQHQSTDNENARLTKKQTDKQVEICSHHRRQVKIKKEIDDSPSNDQDVPSY
ncbi:MAG: hypothetical protein IMW91_09685 [Firmicutes bacterium]|nr:hypothetical protein [Bacillota bacterium]